MKKIIKSCLVASIVFLVSLSLVACGSSSKTEKLFSSINEDTGLHIDITTEDDGGSVSVDFYKLGEDMYIDVDSGGEQFVFIMNDDVLTILDPDTKTGEVVEVTSEIEAELESFTSSAESIYNFGRARVKYSEGTVKIDGMEYATEEAKTDDLVVKFVYNDDDKLVYIITDDGTETTTKINALDGEVSESQFDIPEGYEVLGSSNTSSKSDIGVEYTDQEVFNDEGGYCFKVSGEYNVVKNGKMTTVYTNSEKQVPYFNVTSMAKVSGDTADAFLDRTIDNAWDTYQNRMTGQPEKKSVKLAYRTSKGIEYAYSTVDGTDTIMVETYLDDMGDKWLSWTAVYHKGDAVTPAEMQAAMNNVMMGSE